MKCSLGLKWVNLVVDKQIISKSTWKIFLAVFKVNNENASFAVI